jgi:hypothetical protein
MKKTNEQKLKDLRKKIRFLKKLNNFELEKYRENLFIKDSEILKLKEVIYSFNSIKVKFLGQAIISYFNHLNECKDEDKLARSNELSELIKNLLLQDNTEFRCEVDEEMFYDEKGNAFRDYKGKTFNLKFYVKAIPFTKQVKKGSL